MDRIQNEHYKLISDMFKVLKFEPGDADKELGTRGYNLYKKSGLSFGVKHNSKSKSLNISVGGGHSYNLYYYKEKMNERCIGTQVISEAEYFQQELMRNLVLTREQLIELERLMGDFNLPINIHIGLYEEGCFYMTNVDKEL